MEDSRESLKKIIREVFDIEVEPEITVAPELEDENEEFRADYATNVAMKLTGEIARKTGEKKNPREIAEVLKTEFLKSREDKLPIRVEIAGPGFLNFMLPDEFFIQKLDGFTGNFEKNISRDEYFHKKVVTEFSDPNPFKVLHIGHLYTSIMGESISRMIEFAGGEVHRVNFGGDVGLHVAKTLYILCQIENKTSFSIEDIARAYVEGTRAYEEDEEAKKKIVELNKKIYEISEQGLRDSELAEAYWKGRELSYKYFDEFYARIGVRFEKYYPESTVAGRGIKEVRGHTPEVYQESDGAIVFKGEEFGLHTRVFINKEGLPTYEAKDVGLLFTKNDDYQFDESVVITGNDIIDYMKVVLKSVEQYAPELVEKTRHITHGNVRLPGNEKMSSRKGNFIKAVDVLEAVEERTGDRTLALAAIKYALLKYKIGGNIEFDIDESVSTTGNSGIYLLYSTVRANKIIKNLNNTNEQVRSESPSPSPVSHPPAVAGAAHLILGRNLRVAPESESSLRAWILNPFEVKICKKLVQYPEILGEAIREKAPHIICNYLFETAQEFSRFYENCKVSGDEFEQERKKIVQSFSNVMTHGLYLLGIEVPEEM